MKPIVLTERQWAILKNRLSNDYSPSVMMIRSRMRDKLGFTPRNHHVYNPQTGTTSMVYLDWFNEPQRTMFMLKYCEYFDASRN